MRRFLAVLTLLLLIGPGAYAKTLKVALLLPGSISDASYNAGAYQGIKQAEQRYDMRVSITESLPNAAIEETMLNYARDGFDVIIGHGFQFGEPALKLHKQFPDTWFCINGFYKGEAPNMMAVQNRYYELGVVFGTLSALVSKSGVLSNVTAISVPVIEDFNEGFRQGAQKGKPGTKVLGGIVGSWSDVAKAKEITASHIEQGADIVTGLGNESVVGHYQAAKEAGVWALGMSFDAHGIAPDTIFTTALIKIESNIELMIREIVNGTIEPRMYSLGFKEDGLGIAPYRNFEDKIPADVRKRVADLIEEFERNPPMK